MAGVLASKAPPGAIAARPAATESALGRRILIGITVAFLTLFILIPLINVFHQAFAKGLDGYLAVFFPPEPDPNAVLNYSQKRRLAEAATQATRTWHSIGLTVAVASIVIPLNVIFGLAAAWATTKFEFRGRTLLTVLIDLPFSVSPVVAGLVFVLLLGRNGIFGDWATQLVWPDIFSLRWVGFGESFWPLAFERTHTGIIFTPLAIVIATIFVTFPFVARSLAPLMANLGPDEETAALSLGASGWRTFFKITLPNVKWALLYGVILTLTRAFGEFGAVSVVSGHIDVNDTMPLRIEKLWNEYNNQAAFSVASVLTFLALVSLVAKIAIEWKTTNEAKR
ncbi:ABC transporter permease subunit [Rhodoblastus sp. 17X3]|uniref:sulfate ABC transporter permease n=1 Tax=Rhodoblastus sp. 17X3 TaxID=3047026 RepID=UPI0024B78499|nr:ABC transporter permease subunit [Rhodoblastus sp. 17X3]MDI9850174.1 ABC transporter permease subunit [Rhodoblastus sp. 17X3]